MFAQTSQVHSALGETVRSLKSFLAAKGKALVVASNQQQQSVASARKRLASAPSQAQPSSSLPAVLGSALPAGLQEHLHANLFARRKRDFSALLAPQQLDRALDVMKSSSFSIGGLGMGSSSGSSSSGSNNNSSSSILGQRQPLLLQQARGYSTVRTPRPFSEPFRVAGLARATVAVPRAVQGTQRRLLFSRDADSIDEEELEELFEAADASPRDPKKQAALLEVLCRADPSAAIQRVESKNYATFTNECLRYYVTALVESGVIYKRDLTRLEPLIDAIIRNNANKSKSSWDDGDDVSAPASFSSAKTLSSKLGALGSPASGGFFGGSAGSEHSPLHVVMQEPSPKSQMWRLIRTLILLTLVFLIVSQFIEERGFPGRVGQAGQEIQPEQFHHVTFEDVQGADEAKEELQDVVEFLRNPDKFTRLGGKLPKGVLLVGPPGTGKTLLAKAVAGEAGVPFFYCSGSEFDEMLVGVGARRIRELFAAAKKKSPCIIFMDEIDAVGSKRTSRDQAYSHMTLNQLLVELDGFKPAENVIIIAATNFPETLDPALVRPGRFDTHINVPLPDVRGRESILKAHTRTMPLQNKADLWKLARGTPGFSGAELANIVNQASLKASRESRDTITLADLEWAKDKVAMGAERKKAVITEYDKKVTAYHEGGHALCALYTEGAMPVYKATIIPRGQALGMVTQLPEDDTNSVTRKEMMARLIVCFGGRVAEEKIFGRDSVTSGASSDIEQATKLARAMVTKYGMSDKVGPILHQEDENMAESTRSLIEAETKAILTDAYNQAKALLSKYEREHHTLAKALLEHETLTAEEMRAVIAGKTLPLPRSEE